MARYLVTVSLGPVQSLIGAARRTRDLWAGSWLLSEVSRAAAKVLHDAKPGCLIFPALKNPDTALQPLDQPGDEANIANILRAEIVGEEPMVRALCADAKQAAIRHLRHLGDLAREDLKELREPPWQAQIEDILEVFAAWSLIMDDDYAGASRNLASTLAARKATRDCGPAMGVGDGLLKSSLDGAFETVLPKSPKTGLVRRLALQGNEQLDALGVIKRRAGVVGQFTAYSRLAADSWIADLPPELCQRLKAAYAPLVELDLATGVTGNDRLYEALPYDAQLLYDFRLANALSQVKGDPKAEAALKKLQDEVRAVVKLAGSKPVPYAVILQADGDRMGELLDRATTAEQARGISSALHAFATRVRGIVRDHRGHAIYAGGDDVLALLPLNTAVAAAQALANAFKSDMWSCAEQLKMPQDQAPTLSVGLGIGHLIEPLGTLRERALRAEKLAKGNHLPAQQRRNALGILLGIRSGGETPWRARWDQEAALSELQGYTTAYARGDLPSRVAYDLRDIDRRLSWLRKETGPTATGIRRAEVSRMLERARTRGDLALNPEQRATLLQRSGETSLGELADTLIIARWLAARTQADVEKP
jgi:CRISPR-associated protein Cmr2